MLTLTQFRNLKYEEHKTLVILLLRYNMHFIADVVISDSEGKEKIFLHWAKCKIEKETESNAL